MDETKKIDKMNKEDKSYIDILKEAQAKFPNMVLPSMGMINNEVTVPIQGSDYIRKKGE